MIIYTLREVAYMYSERANLEKEKLHRKERFHLAFFRTGDVANESPETATLLTPLH